MLRISKKLSKGFGKRDITMPPGAPAPPAFGGRSFKEIIMAAQEIPLGYEAKLLNRVEVAEDTMAFHFEKPPGFEFRPGQSSDLTLVNPPESDSEGNVRTFSIASAPFEDRLMFATGMRETAFKRSLKTQTGAALDREKRSRLVSVALPLREQCELGRCPIGTTRRHCGGLAIVRGESREHFVCVVRIRHVGVTVEFYAESFHVRNVNGAKQRFDIR